MGFAKRIGDWGEQKQQEQRDAKLAKAKAALERELSKASHDWHAAMVLREFEGNDKGTEALTLESAVFAEHGYEPWAQSEDGGHVHAGRLLLTGGLSVFAGGRGIRSKGKVKVTFRPIVATAAAAPDIADQIKKLAELRDAGILTADEFDAKKAELLARM